MSEKNERGFIKILQDPDQVIELMKEKYNELLAYHIDPEVLLLGLPFYLADLMKHMDEAEVLAWLTQLSTAVVMCHRHVRQPYMMYS